jgi:hypothetical protein
MHCYSLRMCADSLYSVIDGTVLWRIVKQAHDSCGLGGLPILISASIVLL